jgi:hypothetical protein
MQNGGKWIENKEFDDELKLISYTHGRSSVTFKWQSILTQVTYETSLAVGFWMVTNGMKDNIFKGKFVFVKRGQNYLMEVV